MILSLLFVCVLAVELFLSFGKDYLLGTRRRAALETALRQSYADLQEMKKRLDAARGDLLRTIEYAEGERAHRLEADRAFKQSQKILPNLIHTLGEHGAGTRFRAPLAKQLPEKPEPSQELVWACKNFVDVWASDMEAAREIAVRQFPAKRHYQVGEFVAVTSGEAVRAEEKAA